jgi:hypothetical protein
VLELGLPWLRLAAPVGRGLTGNQHNDATLEGLSPMVENRTCITADDPRWPDFIVRLAARLRTGARRGELNCFSDHRHSRSALDEMGVDTETTLAFFASRAGCCDCEILYGADDGSYSPTKLRATWMN